MPEKDLSEGTQQEKAGIGDKKRALEDMIEKKGLHKPRSVQKKAPETVAEHTVESGDTLSGIALKYYGSAVRDKWMAIYEANKDVIGDDPSLIKPGQKLQIPKLEE